MNSRLFKTFSLLFALGFTAAASSIRSGGELRFCIHADPRTFDPYLVYDEPSEAVRFLTAATLLRLDRKTQQIVPQLATSWKVSNDGRKIQFEIRSKVLFSDGSPLQLTDVALSLKTFFDPAKHAPDADSFGVDLKAVDVRAVAPASIIVAFPQNIAGLERLFDAVAITNARALSLTAKPAEMPVLGPFRIAEYRPGYSIRLERNVHYWKTGEAGASLPYLDAICLYIQANSPLELLRFRHGETDLLTNVDPEMFADLSAQHTAQIFDLGPSLDTEQLWFNQSPSGPLPAYKRRWFLSRNFRSAVSLAINRADIARIAYFSRASPSAGPVSPANGYWFNSKLVPDPMDVREAIKTLQQDGFHLAGQTLQDRDGNVVEFSLITNTGNKARERIAALVQADLAKIGIRLNIVPLDFPALLQRITKTFAYESCLLGLVNNDLDPSGQMNVWLSSGSNHAWNPNQLHAATDWEREIDKLMQIQASETAPTRRKAAFDRVQAISHEQNPALYLVTKHALTAYSASVANPSPSVLFPQAFWNADELYFRVGAPARQRAAERAK